MKPAIPLKLKCIFCEREFRSIEARDAHEREKHPPQHPAPPEGGGDSLRYRYMGFFG